MKIHLHISVPVENWRVPIECVLRENQKYRYSLTKNLSQWRKGDKNRSDEIRKSVKSPTKYDFLDSIQKIIGNL